MFKRTVRPRKFMREHGRHQDLLLVQEAGYVKDAAKDAGMEVITTGTGTGIAIAYQPASFSKTAELIIKRIYVEPNSHGKDRRQGIGMGQRFLDMHTGLTVNVVNVHAGHNHTGDSKVQAKKDIVELQQRLGYSDVTITGGDFNEMTKWVGFGTLGYGAEDAPPTHNMGANDKIGAQGCGVLKAKSKLVGSFGSDHTAVKLQVHLGPTLQLKALSELCG